MRGPQGLRGDLPPAVRPPAPSCLLLPQEPGSRQQYFAHTWEWHSASQHRATGQTTEEGLG